MASHTTQRSFSDFVGELQSLLRSPYALIHLETYEESRATELLSTVAHEDGRPFFQWCAATGSETNTPLIDSIYDVLREVENAQDGALYLLKDLHQYLEDVSLRRRIRDLEAHCALTRKSIVFVGPCPPRYPDLLKDITTVAMPLPCRTLLREVCDQMLPPAQFSIPRREVLIQGAEGLTKKEAERAFHRIGQQWYSALAEQRDFDTEEAILQEKRRLINQDDVLEFCPLVESMDAVGGLNTLKQWLCERKDAFSARAIEFGLPAPKGLLLLGVQGCGKSLTAKVVAHHWSLPLLRLDLGVIFDGRRAPDEALRGAIRSCEAMSPCILWMDEIEKGFANAHADGKSARVLGSLLTWLQEKHLPVFLVATANEVDALPPELLRKGRFDEVFFLDLPDVHARKEILRIHLDKHRRAMPDDVVLEIAQKAEHFSGAELEQIIVSAMYAAFAQKRDIDRTDLLYACSEIVPLYRTYEERIKALREWAMTRARPAASQSRVVDFFQSV